MPKSKHRYVSPLALPLILVDGSLAFALTGPFRRLISRDEKQLHQLPSHFRQLPPYLPLHLVCADPLALFPA